jgi:hypothetical protein
MPRKRLTVDQEAPRTQSALVERLADELKKEDGSGQPLIYEQEFHTGKLRVTVIWDAWERLPLDERSAIILRAYELAEGEEYKNRVALPSGLTVWEAYDLGMLPYQIIPALRDGDVVTKEQVRNAMLEEGASELPDPNEPRLRFRTLAEAEAGKQRLIQRLPGSNPVWVIHNEIMDHDSFSLSQ